MMRARDRYDDESEIEIIPDGGAVRCRLDLMDADPVQRAIAGVDFRDFQPGYRSRADTTVRDARAVARKSRDRYVKNLVDAWRRPGRDMNPGGGFTCPECHGTGRDPDGDGLMGRCDACGGTGYVEAPNNSSSSEGRDPGPYPDPRLRTGGQPDNSSPPEAMRRYLQGRRDEAYRNYTNGLSNAWKADPGRADVVERQAEKWRHGK